IILLLIFHTIQSYINSLHDALPIWPSGDGTPDRLCLRFGPSTSLGCGIRPVRPGDSRIGRIRLAASRDPYPLGDAGAADAAFPRSEEHTSELQSREKIVSHLLFDKK